MYYNPFSRFSNIASQAGICGGPLDRDRGISKLQKKEVDCATYGGSLDGNGVPQQKTLLCGNIWVREHAA